MAQIVRLGSKSTKTTSGASFALSNALSWDAVTAVVLPSGHPKLITWRLDTDHRPIRHTSDDSVDQSDTATEVAMATIDGLGNFAARVGGKVLFRSGSHAESAGTASRISVDVLLRYGFEFVTTYANSANTIELLAWKVNGSISHHGKTSSSISGVGFLGVPRILALDGNYVVTVFRTDESKLGIILWRVSDDLKTIDFVMSHFEDTPLTFVDAARLGPPGQIVTIGSTDHGLMATSWLVTPTSIRKWSERTLASFAPVAVAGVGDLGRFMKEFEDSGDTFHGAIARMYAANVMSRFVTVGIQSGNLVLSYFDAAESAGPIANGIVGDFGALLGAAVAPGMWLSDRSQIIWTAVLKPNHDLEMITWKLNL